MSAKLFLFGQFRWELTTGFVVPPLREKTQALIAYIALSGNGVVRRRHAAELLWEGGRDPNASLRQSIREIKSLEEKQNSSLFAIDSKYLTLNLNELWVDVRLATQCAHAFKTGLAEQLVDCQLGMFMDTCSIKEEAFDDWLVTERSRRENDLNFTLEKLLEDAMRKESDTGRQKKIAAALLRVDSTNEVAHRALMTACLREGDRASALRQYEQCEITIKRELGVEPSEKTQALTKKIRSKAALLAQRVEVLTGSVPQNLAATPKPVIQMQSFAVSPQEELLDYFAQAFQADMSEQLSRNRRFFVRDSASEHMPGITIKTNSANAASTDAATYPDYIVRGSIMAASNQMTFLVQLYDSVTGNILWMTRLSPEPAEVLSDSSEGARLAAVEMLRFIELQETEKANTTEDGMLNARQCVIRAVSSMFKFSAEAVVRADRYLQRALLLQPNYPDALAWLAFLKSIEVGQGFTQDVEATKDEIGTLVQHAIELTPHDDVILAIAGHLEAFIHHDFESAVEFFDRALTANPNCSYAWGFNAITNCYLGKPDEALAMLERCRKIMPFDPHPYYFDTARCIASMLAGKYEDAVRIGRQVLRNNPNFHANYRPLISSLGHLGRQDEAEPVVHEFEKYQPDFSVSWHLQNYPPLDDEKTEAYIDGLRKAGVSE